MLEAIDCIRNGDKQRPDADAICKYISRTEISNVNKTDIKNTIDVIRQTKCGSQQKISSGYE